MDLLPSIFDAELTFGPVERLTGPAEYIEPLTAALTAASSEYPIPLITEGEPGLMVITISGRDWPYGGL